MITKPLTVAELKAIYLECLLDKTDKLSKVSDNSVLNGVAYGSAKVAQKAMKDIALMESSLFIDAAFGSTLDEVAARNGISERFTALGSSTYVRLVGSEGTLYEQGVHLLSGSHGIIFEFEQDVIIGEHGYVYAKVRSTTTGERTNVDALSINSISPVPAGHLYLINEITAQGGMDEEDDNSFKKRIKEGVNLCARDTISYLNQVLMKIDNRILRVFYLGINDNGKNILSIVTQNGVGFTTIELNTLLDKAREYLSITELNAYGRNSVGVIFENISWTYIDMDFRVELESGYDTQEIRKQIQIRVSKYLDFRFWDYKKKVEWDDLLSIVKMTQGIKSVSDNTFYPAVDIIVPYTTLPRCRSMIIRDLNGDIIEDVQGSINPIFYPNTINLSYSRTILASI